jgi:hypothetical protein
VLLLADAAANFSVMLQSLGGNCTGLDWQACMLQEVQLAAKHGLKIVPTVPTIGAINRVNGSNVALRPISTQIATNPAFWGFDFYDEPNTKVFPSLANLSRQVGALYPGKVRFINLCEIQRSIFQHSSQHLSRWLCVSDD